MIARLLSLYIARRFTAMLALIFAAVAIIILLADYVEVLRRFSDSAAFTSLLGLQLALMRVPFLLDAAVPFAFLFAALLSLLSLSRKLELVVARASGVSVWGFLRAPFAVALLFGVLASSLLNPLAIKLKEATENMEAELSGRAARGGAGVWFRQESAAGPSIVHGGSVRDDGMALFGVTAFVFDGDGEFREKVAAPRAEYDENRWILSNARVVPASSAARLTERYELPTDLAANELHRSVFQPEAASLWSLPSFIAAADSTGVDSDRFRLAFHLLLSRPLFLLAMVTIAATVSLRLSRFGGTWRLILTGAAAGFLLYVITEIVSDLGANGIIDPILAAWLPPVVALTLGATTLLYQEDG
jgi:lipopolysaccharide export system permease protein